MASLSPTKTKVAARPLAAKKTAAKTVKTVAKKVTSAKAQAASDQENLDLMFSLAAETFRVMSAPMRLKIINSLCTEEKNVGQLLAEIDTTQPNMSQHLNTLFKAKILGRRREGVQIYYRIINDRVVTLCRAVCTQIAIDSDIAH
ncbi:transcriptional regulator [Limnohabitans sp. B9-3]|jgi:DNA-binding transcriptional ArsR family regulator|nr:transcriptional regulator [Limnohabitans sp. B9-3]